MRSLYSGISGLKVHQTKMDVIANNISNVNTVGYKSSRVTFSDFFSQTVSGASGANAASGRGGTNPMQIGLGANVASIDINMNAGMGQRTDNNFDLLIDGSGFFVVGDNSGQYFTRAGAFNVDAQGNLVTSGGLAVYGWDVDANGQPVREVVQPIQINGDKVYSPPQTTTQIELNGNLNSASAVGDKVTSTMRMYDSLGNYYTYNIQYELTGSDGTNTTWEAKVGDVVYPNGDTNKPLELTYSGGTFTIGDAVGTPHTLDYATSLGNVIFDNEGIVSNTAPLSNFGGSTDGTSADFTVVLDSADMPAAVFGAGDIVSVDFGDLTQFNQKSDASSEMIDGYTAGQLSDLNVGADGTIVGTYSNGQTRVIYQIPVAQFANPAGLSKVGGNLFQQTINSGTFDGIGEDITASGGSVSAGMLEMSNVDLSSEFTEMITTQRGFQANSRIITTSDSLLEELVNLKR